VQFSLASNVASQYYLIVSNELDTKQESNMTRKITTTDRAFSAIIADLAAYFVLPEMGTDRDTGAPTTTNDLRFAQDSVLRSVANALFYQLKSASDYHARAVQIGRDMLNNTRASEEDRLSTQRDRIIRAQAQKEIIASAFRDAVATYQNATGKDWSQPNYTPRANPQLVTGAAADLAALVGGPAERVGEDLALTTGDTRQHRAA